MRPRVIVHNEVSLDGRVDWVVPHYMELFYSLASRWKPDAQLCGSGTFLAATASLPTDESPAAEQPAPQPAPDDVRPLVVIVDSRGMIKAWRAVLRMLYWRGGVALCSRTTPSAHLEDLRRWGVDALSLGEDKVDLAAGLEVLNERYGVKTVLVDSGGTLNGVLLRAGLVDEVSLLFSPCLVGGTSSRSIYRAPDLTSEAGVIPHPPASVRSAAG